jgi:hypothetical protein
MAATPFTVQRIQRSGLEATYAAAASGEGNSFANSGNTFLHVKNGSGSEVTVTIASTAVVDGLAVADATVAVPAGEDRMIGPFSTTTFGSTVTVTFSATTSVTVAAITL